MTTSEYETQLIKLLDSLTLVNSGEELISWVGKELQATFPHGAFIFGVGEVKGSGVVPIKLYTSNFPMDYLRSLTKSNGLYFSSTFRLWLETNEVQLLNDENTSDASLEPEWLQNFRRSGLLNMAAYGIYDSSHRYASYFSFHQIPESLGERHCRLLKIFIPSMHAALLRILNNPKSDRSKLGRSGTLSPREIEILNWVSARKTSYEIAIILGISCSTVRNHIQKILGRLRVSTRSQAIAEANNSGLMISPPQNSHYMVSDGKL